MIAYFGGAGFLRPHSSIGADLSLVIMLAAFAMLTLGVVLAMTKHFVAHRWVQTTAVALNSVPVVFWMIRSFWLYLVPGLPGNLSKPIDILTVVHAIAGLIGVVLGVSTVIVASRLAAKGKSLRRYKNRMRAAYVVYLLATALGVWVYASLYG